MKFVLRIPENLDDRSTAIMRRSYYMVTTTSLERKKKGDKVVVGLED
jgi:hypothetical protein